MIPFVVWPKIPKEKDPRALSLLFFNKVAESVNNLSSKMEFLYVWCTTSLLNYYYMINIFEPNLQRILFLKYFQSVIIKQEFKKFYIYY